MHGQFVLVQLENPNEAVLGRIASLSSDGKLAAGTGEEFNIRAMREGRSIPEDLRQDYLKYRVNIRVLGVIRANDRGKPDFVASHRRLPHVGSPVAFPSPEVLREIAGHNEIGAEIGCLALGEFIYSGASTKIDRQSWMQTKQPEVFIKFPVESLVSRRSFIFARAGFGKSNLNKLLFSKLYSSTPVVQKRSKLVPVGTVIFDPDGEYFWPDDKGRPGLCDVPELEDKLVVFTSRRGPSPFYQSFVAGGIRLDIRRLLPSDVIAIALSPDRQDQQNVRKLRSLSQGKWEELVDLIDRHRNQTPLEDVARVLDLDHQKQEAEALAARANMTAIVGMLHDRGSQLLDLLLASLSAGKLCVIDFSQMRGNQGLILSGLILRRIFDRNQQEFTAADPKMIPTIAVVEEAQAVLNSNSTAAEPYISWVKEGRKYDLGVLLVTQQPGSIPSEILSQGDNWFIFHLLSSGDLASVRKANAHFSEDLLGSLLNEPIPGQGVFWSSVAGKPYPVPLRVLSFESLYPLLDPQYQRSPAQTFAQKLLQDFAAAAKSFGLPTQVKDAGFESSRLGVLSDAEPRDMKSEYEERAIDALKSDAALMAKLRRPEGVAWGELKAFFLKHLPEQLDDVDQFAYRLVAKGLDAIFGYQQWENERRPNRGGHMTTYVHKKSHGSAV